jgi:ABC-type polysaccharide/polyol phosphate export permease
LNGAAIGYLLAPLAALMNDVRVAVHSSTIVLMGASSVFVTLSTSGSEFFFWSSAINPVSVFVENARYWLVSTPTGVSHFLLSWIPLTFVLSLFSLALNRLVKQIIAERL